MEYAFNRLLGLLVGLTIKLSTRRESRSYISVNVTDTVSESPQFCYPGAGEVMSEGILSGKLCTGLPARRLLADKIISQQFLTVFHQIWQ